MAYTGDDIQEVIYRFVFAFSRLEYALKQAGLVREGPRSSALPDWHGFEARWSEKFEDTENSLALRELAPARQCVDADGCTYWEPLELDGDRSVLQSTCAALRTVRNNLFHGGKHGEHEWDNAARIKELLIRGTGLIEELCDIDADVAAHFHDRY